MNMNIFLIIRSMTIVCIFAVSLIVVENFLPNNSIFTNSAFAETAKSPYKKSFVRSQRINATKSKVRSSGRSSSCVEWNAKKINDKANQFNAYIDQYAREYRIDKNLIKAVITAESCFQVKAESNKGAQGLMQLIPATAERFGVTNSFKPQQNIRGGTKYLRFLMDRFNSDLRKVVASYNAGEGAVEKYKGIPPYKETQKYVKNVLQVYAVLDPNAAKKYNIGYPPIKGKKAGRQGWEYNKRLAPHLYKK